MAKTLVGALRVTLGLDSAEFAAGVQRVNQLSQQMAKRLAVIGSAVSVVGAGVATAIRGALNTADDMGELAQKLGVPIESLTALKYAAKVLGVEFDTLQAGLLRLSRGMADSPERFEKLGIAVRDANGEMRPTSDVLKDLSERFQSMPDGAEKTALAMDLFGKSGAAMIPMLNAGAEGIGVLMAEAKKLGLVISKETAESAGRFNENLDRLRGVAEGLALVIASHLAPVLERISGFLVEMAAAFQTLDPFTQKFIAWAAGLTVVLGPVILSLGLLVGAIGALITPVTLAAAKIALVVAAVYAIYELGLSEVIDRLRVAFVSLVDNGIALVAGALGATQEQIQFFQEAFWQMLDLVKQMFVDLASGIAATMQGIFDGMVVVWEGIKTTIGGAIDYVIGKWNEFIGLLTGAVETAKAAGQAIADALSTGRSEMNSGSGYGGMGGAAGDNPAAGMGFDPASYSAGQSMTDGIITGAANRMFERSGELAAVMTRGLQVMKDAAQIASPSKVTEGFGRNLAEGLALGMTNAQGLVGQAAQGLTDTASTALKGIGDLGGQIADMFAGAATNVLTGVESLQEAVGKLLQQLAQLLINSAMKQLFGNIFGGLGGGLGGGLRGYASGTMNAAAGWAMVGEEGPELVRMRGGERVFDAGQTDRMMQGGNAGGASPTMVTQIYLDGEMILEQIDSPQGEAVIARVNRRLGMR
jgi:phage-related protein